MRKPHSSSREARGLWPIWRLAYLFIFAENVEAYAHARLPPFSIVGISGSYCHDSMPPPFESLWQRSHHISKPTCKLFFSLVHSPFLLCCGMARTLPNRKLGMEGSLLNPKRAGGYTHASCGTQVAL